MLLAPMHIGEDQNFAIQTVSSPSLIDHRCWLHGRIWEGYKGSATKIKPILEKVEKCMPYTTPEIQCSHRNLKPLKYSLSGNLLNLLNIPCQGNLLKLLNIPCQGNLFNLLNIPCQGDLLNLLNIPCQGNLLNLLNIPCQGDLLNLLNISYTNQPEADWY